MSHTYIQKLVQQFAIDSGEMQREAHRHTAATFEHLNRAREETRQEKRARMAARAETLQASEVHVSMLKDEGGGAYRIRTAVAGNGSQWPPARPGVHPVSRATTLGKGIALLLKGESL